MNSLVEVYETFGRSFISVYKKAKKGPTDAFYRSENINEMFWFCNTVNLYEADTFRTFPSVRLKEVCAMFVLTKFVKINIQKLLCTVIKFHEVLYFEQDF